MKNLDEFTETLSAKLHESIAATATRKAVQLAYPLAELRAAIEGLLPDERGTYYMSNSASQIAGCVTDYHDIPELEEVHGLSDSSSCRDAILGMLIALEYLIRQEVTKKLVEQETDKLVTGLETILANPGNPFLIGDMRSTVAGDTVAGDIGATCRGM
jgi:hypothetical protein